jgi:RNA ligase (TIGR02306 family)
MIIEKDGMCWTGIVDKVSDIPKADKIKRVEVVCGKGGKWSCVMDKDTKVGDRVIVFLHDAIVPNMPETAFMEKHKWRVKMMRLRGCPSEVLAIKGGNTFVVGADITKVLGVKKYEKDIPTCIGGDVVGNFPSFIPKTDEHNFQRVPEMLSALEGKRCYGTVKYDGTSQTFFSYNGKIGACSRNWELKESDTAAWRLVKRYNLDTIKTNVGVQWECVGPKIQNNPLQLSEVDARVFNVYDIDNKEYLGLEDMIVFCKNFNLPMVEVVMQETWEKYSDDDIRELATGNYTESGKTREGIVVRPTVPMRVDGESLSFKIINLDYKG